jgi:hypothetical protein
VAKAPRWTTNPKVLARLDIGSRRLLRVLASHTIANARTLEQKIADAGPYNQRVEPIYLTIARKALQQHHRIAAIRRDNTPWYHLPETPLDEIEPRLAEQLAVHQAISRNDFIQRVGQALEIAIVRTMREGRYRYLGDFADLDEHDDASLYRKEEPPTSIGGHRCKGPVDFLLHLAGDWLAIEAKNVRPWIYPDSDELLPLLQKAAELDAIPVLIARRVSYVAFTEVLEPCGVIVHQVFNQRYPSSERELAAKAAHKSLLGYHDIRASSDPDDRLRRFLLHNLPKLVPHARAKFDQHKDLLLQLGSGEISYKQFHVELRLRLGIYTEHPEHDIEPPDYDPDEY